MLTVVRAFKNSLEVPGDAFAVQLGVEGAELMLLLPAKVIVPAAVDCQGG